MCIAQYMTKDDKKCGIDMTWENYGGGWNNIR